MVLNNIFNKYNQFIFGSIFLLYFLYTFFNAMQISKETVIALAFTPFIYLQSVGEFLYFYKKKGKPRLQDWIRIALFVMLVLSFMTIVNQAEGISTVKVVITTVSLNDAPFTMIIIIIALFSLDIAYLFSNIFKKYKNNNIHYIIKRKEWVFWILILSTLIQSYLLFSGAIGIGGTSYSSSGFTSLLKILTGILNSFALIISAYIIFVERSYRQRYKIIFYFAILLQSLVGALSGMKEYALLPIFYTGIVFLFAGGKLPKKIIIIGFFILILLYPVNNAYREVIKNPYINTGSHISNMGIAIHSIMENPILETLESGSKSYGDRGAMFPFLQYSIDIEASWSYTKYMTRYIVLPITWMVPRVIWADKPKADIGGVLYAQIVGERASTAITPTTLGWAYLEGGVLFVVIIFIMLGLLFEFMDKQNHKRPIILLLYIILLHKAIKPEWDAYFFFAGIIQMYIMYWVLLKVIGVKKGKISNEN